MVPRGLLTGRLSCRVRGACFGFFKASRREFFTHVICVLKGCERMNFTYN
jgi:hypothetical protein